MTTRVWNGGIANFFSAAAWTPRGQPVSGDSLDIVGGTAKVSRQVLDGLSIQLGEAPLNVTNPGPALLELRNGTIAANTTVAVGGITLGATNSGSSSATIDAFAHNVNDGTISVAGFAPQPGVFPNPAQLAIDLNGSGSTFVNDGTLRTASTPTTLVVEGQNNTDVLTNNGLIDDGSVVQLNLKVIGVGKMQFGAPYYIGPSPHALTGPEIDTTGAVGFGQTVDFMAASGVDSHGQLSIGDPQDFHALIKDFVTSPIVPPGIAPLFKEDMISLNLPNLTSSAYQSNATGGVLTLTAGSEVAHLRFAGSYSLSSFQITTSSTGTDVIIKPT